MDVYPDGGMARVRLWGALSSQRRDALELRWFDSLPDRHLRQVLDAGGAASEAQVADTLSRRGSGPLPPAVATLLHS